MQAEGFPSGKVALVTGASGAIGRKILEMLQSEGARVVAVTRSRTVPGATDVLECDLSSSDAVQTLVERVRARHKRIDILVHCAGMMRPALLTETSDALWTEMIASNLTSTFLLMRATLPLMIAQSWGRVVVIASVSAKLGDPRLAAYSASKHGVLGLTRGAALQAAAHGVTVNAICPGVLETAGTQDTIEQWAKVSGKSTDTARYVLESFSPQNRMFDPDEVTATVRFLLSDAAVGINGQAINICGGASFY